MKAGGMEVAVVVGRFLMQFDGDMVFQIFTMMSRKLICYVVLSILFISRNAAFLRLDFQKQYSQANGCYCLFENSDGKGCNSSLSHLLY